MDVASESLYPEVYMPVNFAISNTNQLSRSQNAIQESLNNIATGKRINSAKDDAAGLAIANQLSTQARGFNVAQRNANDGISYTQIAQSALQNVNESFQRIRELAIQSNNAIFSDEDREAIQLEVDSLKSEISNVMENTRFNGQSVLSTSELKFQVGESSNDNISVTINDIAASVLGSSFEMLNVSTAENASAAMDVIDSSMKIVNETSASLGAVESVFSSSIRSLESANLNTEAARSRIEDSDIAKESTALTASLIQREAALAVQSHQKVAQSAVLRLLG